MLNSPIPLGSLIALALTAGLAAAQGSGPLEKPRTEWKQEETGKITSPAVAVNDRILYVVDKTRLVCRTLEYGERLWERRVESAARPVASEKSVWVGARRFATVKGDVERNGNVTGEIVAPPALTESHCIVGSTSGKLYCIELATGSPVWTYDVGPVHHAPMVHQGRVFVVNESGGMHAFDIAKRKVLWRVELEAKPLGPPVRYKTQLFVPVRDEILLIESKTGVIAAKRIAAKGICCPLRGQERLLCYGTDDGVCVRVDAETQTETGRMSVAARAVTEVLPTRDGMIYGAAGNRLFAVHGRTGARLWVYDGDADFLAPITTDDLILAGSGKVFYCLR